LIRGNPEGWGSPAIVACLGGALALLLAFLAIEARSSHPMLDLVLFRKPAFVGVSAVAFGLSAGMFAMFLYLTIYMQGVLGYSPLETGLHFLPLTMLSFIASPISGNLSHRIPIRILVGSGLALVGVGLILMRGLDAGSEISALLPGFLVAGIGIGIVNPGIGQGAIAVVPTAKAGMGSGINTTFRQVGIATGVASLGAVFQARVDSKLSALLPNASDGLAEAVASGGSRAAAESAAQGQRTEVVHAAKVAFVSGFNDILLIGALVAFVGAALGFALVRSSDFVTASPDQEPAEVAPA
jgi:predicted MFS family arabinose efflux permease